MAVAIFAFKIPLEVIGEKRGQIEKPLCEFRFIIKAFDGEINGRVTPWLFASREENSTTIPFVL